MKDRKLLVLGALVSILAVLGIWTSWNDNTFNDFEGALLEPKSIPTHVVKKIRKDIKASVGTKEDPNARYNFEILRQQNPVTKAIPANMREKELRFAERLPVRRELQLRGANGQMRTAQTASFEKIGPVNVGGRTRALAIDRSDPTEQTILAGGVSGGMWISTTGGASWDRTTRDDQLPSVSCIVQDTREGNDNTWYYGTGEIIPGNSASKIGSPYRGDGIFKSTDGGNSWNIIEATSTGTNTELVLFSYINNMVINTNAPNDVTEIYAAVAQGIVRTTDDFATYDIVLGADNREGTWTDIAITSTGTLYATISNTGEGNNNSKEVGIFTSEDGENWTQINPTNSENTREYRRTVIGIAPSNEAVVYFIRNYVGGGDEYGLFKYDASEASWEDLSENIPLDAPEDILNYNAQGSYNMVIQPHPADEDIVFLGGTNLYRSMNGFRSTDSTEHIGGYSRLARDNRVLITYGHYVDQHAIVFYEDPNRMLTGNDGGIRYTDNNLEDTITVITEERDGEDVDVDDVMVIWESLNNGYITSQFYTLAVDEFDGANPLAMGGMQDNSTYITFSGDPNVDWQNIGGGDGAFCDFSYNSIFASSQFANIFRYDLSGEVAELDFLAPPGTGTDDNASENYLFVNPFEVDPVNPHILYVGARDKVYYSNDVRQHNSEDDYMVLAENELRGRGFTTALAASVEPRDVLYIATYNPNNGAPAVFRVADTQAPTTAVNVTGNNFPMGGGYINCLTVDPQDANHVFAVFSNYGVQSIFESNNGGQSWTPIGGNLEENPDGSGDGPAVNWLTIMPNGSSPIYYVGTSVGLFSTQELNGNSTQWEQEGLNSIGNAVVDMVKVNASDGHLVAATHGNGVFDARVAVEHKPKILMDDERCEGANITLMAPRTYDAGIYAPRFQWFRNGEAMQGEQNYFIEVNDEGSEYYVLINERNTDVVTESNRVTIKPWRCTTTSIEETIAVEDDILVYPNPAPDGYYNIRLKDAITGDFTISIIDRNGRKISEQAGRGFLRNQERTIDLSQHAQGTYILEIKSNRGTIREKLLKNN